MNGSIPSARIAFAANPGKDVIAPGGELVSRRGAHAGRGTGHDHELHLV